MHAANSLINHFFSIDIHALTSSRMMLKVVVGLSIITLSKNHFWI